MSQPFGDNPFREEDIVAELERLVEGCLSGELNAEERRRMEALVASQPAARRRYVSLMHDAYQLRRLALLALDTEPSPAQPEEAVIAPPRSRAVLRTLNWQTHPLRFAAAASVLTAAVWLLFFTAWMAGLPGGNESPTKRATPQIAFAARLTKTYAAQWGPEHPLMRKGEALRGGRELHLDHGWAEITFAGGATATLEGPAVLRVVDARRAVLVTGRLTASVSPRGVGFRVGTPVAEIIDLGTEFGLQVADSGATDVLVYTGAVRIALDGRMDRDLLAGESLRIEREHLAGPPRTLPLANEHRPRLVRGLTRLDAARTVLALDFNARAFTGPEATQAGFEEFTLDPAAPTVAERKTLPSPPTTRQYGSLTVRVRGVDCVIDDRHRVEVVGQGGFSQAKLLNDFIFGPQADEEALEVEIAGLDPQSIYRLTLWSFDPHSRGPRLSEWSVGARKAQPAYRFDGRRLPTSNDDYRFDILLRPDAKGVVVLRGAHHPETRQYSVFLNALRLIELQATADTDSSIPSSPPDAAQATSNVGDF